MIASRIYNSIFFFLLMVLVSCKYSPDFIPESGVNPLTAEDTIILIDLQPGQDTIKVYKPTMLQYTINTLGKDLYKVEFYLNDELLGRHEYISTPYNFEFNPTGFIDGNYTLKILIYTSFDDGSIAGRAGAMSALFEVKWPLLIDKTEPRILKFISIDTVGSAVRVTWEKFRHPSFESYKLVKTSAPLGLDKVLLTSDDPDVNSFTDNEYVEGMVVTYELMLNNHYNLITKKEYFQIPPKPVVTYVKNFEVDVSWKPPKNINFFDYYYVHTSKTTVSLDPQNKIHDISLRTQRKNVIFGVASYFGVLYVPKSVTDGSTANLIRGEAEFSLGDKMPVYNYAFPVPNTPVVLLTNKGKLYRYNLSSGIITDSLQFLCEVPDYLSVSGNGNFFGYSENGNFILRSTQDLSFISTITSEDYAGLSSIMYMFSVSNTKRLATVLQINILSVFDLATGIKLAEKKFENLYWITAKISPDGNYVTTLQNDNVGVKLIYYKITGNQFIEVARVTDSDLSLSATMNNPYGPDQDIYLIFRERVEVRNLNDFSLKKVIQLRGIELIDYQNMSAAGYDADYLGSSLAYLYNLDSEAITKNLSVYYISTMKLHGNFLFGKNGRRLNLNNIQ